eukprot:Skav223686  [mRNA]  locus=scaffold1907:33125:36655:- [translate_table: standard]
MGLIIIGFMPIGIGIVGMPPPPFPGIICPPLPPIIPHHWSLVPIICGIMPIIGGLIIPIIACWGIIPIMPPIFGLLPP